VVLITHKLDEVFQVADRVTVLRKGKPVLSDLLVSQTRQSLSHAMIGSETVGVSPPQPVVGDVLVLATAAVCALGNPISPVSFAVRSGEIVGIAAVEGNGQRTLMRTLADVDGARITSGTLEVATPVAFMAEDRTTEGIVASFTLAENLLLTESGARSAVIDWRAVRVETEELARAHDVRPPNANALAGTLSGGNQQKFVLARALHSKPKVIVAENPTRGLDLLAAAAVHEKLREAAASGAAVFVHSSDLDEVMALATRLFIVAQGVVTELPIDSPRSIIGDAMLGMSSAA
jgi:ABC-type uncharacterized transport system ATPase subunit